MEKNKVHIVVGGTTYSIITEDDPDYVTDLAEALNNEIRQTMAETPSLSQTQAAVLVALDQMDYLEDSARARMEADVARHEIERLNREIANLRGKLAQK